MDIIKANLTKKSFRFLPYSHLDIIEDQLFSWLLSNLSLDNWTLRVRIVSTLKSIFSGFFMTGVQIRETIISTPYGFEISGRHMQGA